jgi:hypothetical protein
MLWANRRARARIFIHGFGCLAACAVANVAGAAASPSAQAVSMPRVAAQTPVLPGPGIDCVTGTPHPDFEPISNPNDTSQYINVGAFFDRLRRSTVDHFLIKYFEPPAPGNYRIEGFSMRVFANMGSDVLHAAGVIKTAAGDGARFPTADALQSLQVLRVDGRGTATDTCVDLASFEIDLAAGEAAWLVVQFPEAGHFIGVLADLNHGANPDRNGDYMTRNGGLLWYRPDPAQSPTYDWALTPYVSTRAQRAGATWTACKQLYR